MRLLQLARQSVLLVALDLRRGIVQAKSSGDLFAWFTPEDEMKTIAICLILTALFTAAVLNGAPIIPAFAVFMIVAAVVLIAQGKADSNVNKRAGDRIDQRNAARDAYWGAGGQGDPPGLDQQLPRLPEVSGNVTVEIIAVLLAVAFLAYALYS